MICVLCEKPIIESRQSCDPFPLSETGRCCKDCDMRKVLPARAALSGKTIPHSTIEAMIQAEKLLRAKMNQRIKDGMRHAKMKKAVDNEN